MLLQVGSNRPFNVSVDDFPGKFAIQLDTQEELPETGLFLEYDGQGATRLNQRLTPVPCEDDQLSGDGVRTFVIPSPKDFGGIHYRCTWLNYAVYMEYTETIEIVVRRYSESGWGVTLRIPGMDRTLSFSFEDPAPSGQS